MPKRVVPNLYITLQEGVDFSAIQHNEQIQALLYDNVVKGIKTAIKTNKSEATIVELNSSGNYISISYVDWKKSLEKAQNYFANLEQYEVCADIQKLIESINSYGPKRLHRKVARTNKSNNRSIKHTKAT
jgi:hypothetical protein